MLNEGKEAGMSRHKRIVAVGASILALGAGGAAIASATGVVGEDANETPITGSALEKASAAALAETGEGTVSGTEVGDEESKYEVEVTLDNGDERDVQLDAGFNVVGGETDKAGQEEAGK
jgi:hypothetical protein